MAKKKLTASFHFNTRSPMHASSAFWSSVCVALMATSSDALPMMTSVASTPNQASLKGSLVDETGRKLEASLKVTSDPLDKKQQQKLWDSPSAVFHESDVEEDDDEKLAQINDDDDCRA